MNNMTSSSAFLRPSVSLCSRLRSAWPVFALAAAGISVPNAQAYEGFGSQTPGGSGQPIVHVTNLNDAGPGSLRTAVSSGYRTVVFDVAGTITLPQNSPIMLGGPYITIDGSSAPSPGVTIQGGGLQVLGRHSPRYYSEKGGRVDDIPGEAAHDVIIRNIRIRDTQPHADGILVGMGACNVVIDRVSVSNAGDGSIDVSESHDVTISWCILAWPNCTEPGNKFGGSKNCYITYQSYNVSLHHNIFYHGEERNPTIRYFVDPYVTADVRNNLVWGFGYSGTAVDGKARANIVNNYYHTPFGNNPNSLNIDAGEHLAYVAGNYNPTIPSNTLNSVGVQTSAYPSASVTTTDAITAAWNAYDFAGVRPLDPTDQSHLDALAISDPRPSGSAPPSSRAQPGGASHVWIEAESAGGQSLFTPFAVLSDAGASGGQCIASASYNTGSPPAIGHVTFRNTLRGTAAVWIRMYCPAFSSDSFWVKYGAGTFANFNNSGGAFGEWVWKKWGEVAAMGTLTIAYREADTRLDRVLFTMDLKFTPTGTGL